MTLPRKAVVELSRHRAYISNARATEVARLNYARKNEIRFNVANIQQINEITEYFSIN